jgi:1-aminocyclopropane-1-carboxylate deaminase/D-cysteine desulfhydrase-like pyridoxal-dependent ACC family enzyme
VGTGTTLAGLVRYSSEHQQCIGISCMKSNHGLQEQVNQLLPKHLHNHFKIEHHYHFGGYAKHPHALVDFINETYHAYQLPLDIIYTGKTFYAIQEMAKNNVFEKDSNILIIHTGGLQGNKSLANQVLAF